MEAIGGYFELADYEEGVLFPHQDGILLNTGRNALEYILRSIGEVKGIYLPYYTCEVVLEPLKRLKIPWAFYHIDAKLEIDDEINPKVGEYIIANNYFGIKDDYIRSLVSRFGDHLIVDCAQALFAKPIPGVKCFYSTRKFVGVADGGVAYLGNAPSDRVPVNEVECTADHDSHLYKRKLFGAEAGFTDYQTNEIKLDNQPIRWMSNTTKRILEHIDYSTIIEKRKENYIYLHGFLAEKNSLVLPKLDSFECPMVYPFHMNSQHRLREKLIDNKVFIAKYWANVKDSISFSKEYELSEGLLALPCDQRYTCIQLSRIIDLLN